MTERLYHEIACPSLTKTGPCNCTTQIIVVERLSSSSVADSPTLEQRDYAVIAEAVDEFLGFDITTREQQDRITRWAKSAAPSASKEE